MLLCGFSLGVSFPPSDAQSGNPEATRCLKNNENRQKPSS
ncbi:MAG: hypothetical protein JWO28_735 [Hyphomicrobiales bacterium]|nr:hypothetical protein [Hyphomicrobiales bacterium]